MNELAQGHTHFTVSEVSGCKKDTQPGACLEKLYHKKTDYDLNKIKLCEIFVDYMMSPDSRRRIENQPIVKVLERVERRATLNPLPTTQQIWVMNQRSGYLSRKRKLISKWSRK